MRWMPFVVIVDQLTMVLLFGKALPAPCSLFVYLEAPDLSCMSWRALLLFGLHSSGCWKAHNHTKTMSLCYIPPFNLHSPALAIPGNHNKYKLRYDPYYHLQAFFAVTRTKKKSEKELWDAWEKNYMQAVDSCPHQNDPLLKSILKEENKGDGKGGWRCLKDTSQ